MENERQSFATSSNQPVVVANSNATTSPSSATIDEKPADSTPAVVESDPLEPSVAEVPVETAEEQKMQEGLKVLEMLVQSLPKPAAPAEPELGAVEPAKPRMTWHKRRVVPVSDEVRTLSLIEISRDGSRVAFASKTKILAFDVSRETPLSGVATPQMSGAAVNRRRGESYPGLLTGLGLSPDGSLAITGFQPTGLDLCLAATWNLEKGTNARVYAHSDGGFGGNQVSAAAFSADGTKILTFSADGLMMWSVQGNKPLKAFQGHSSATNVNFSDDGEFVYAMTETSGIVYGLSVWEIKTGRGVQQFIGPALAGLPAVAGAGDAGRSNSPRDPNDKAPKATCVALSASAELLLVGRSDLEKGNSLVLLHVASREPRFTFEPSADAPLGTLRSVAFSHDGQLAVSVEEDKNYQLRVWDVFTGRQLANYPSSSRWRKVTFSGTTHDIVAVAGDGIYLWSPGGETEFRTWKTAEGKFQVIAQFVGMSGDKVQLRRQDNGTVREVPRNLLSEEDQKYLQEHAR